MEILPKIILLSAQTSNNLFLSELRTQWNSGRFSFNVQFFVFATAVCLLQFFIRAAMSHSSLDVGQDVTTLTSLTASWQSWLTLNGNCCKKFKTNILILGFFLSTTITNFINCLLSLRLLNTNQYRLHETGLSALPVSLTIGTRWPCYNSKEKNFFININSVNMNLIDEFDFIVWFAR